MKKGILTVKGFPPLTMLASTFNTPKFHKFNIQYALDDFTRAYLFSKKVKLYWPLEIIGTIYMKLLKTWYTLLIALHRELLPRLNDYI